MRRIVAIAAAAAAAATLAAGCGEQAASAPRLVVWTFPHEVFIPRVEATPDVGEVDAAPDEPQADVEPPAASRGSRISPGAPTDAEVRAQLRRLYGEPAVRGSGGGLRRTVLLSGGHAEAPPDAPRAVQRIVAGANQVARLPYVYGGGHGRAEGLFVDTAYDCSGSISFALANAGLVDRPMTSGELMHWGEPGQGEWVTIYANEGHAFMVVGGARFDTVGLRETGSRWQRPFRSVRGFTAVHPPGL